MFRKYIVKIVIQNILRLKRPIAIGWNVLFSYAWCGHVSKQIRFVTSMSSMRAKYIAMIRFNDIFSFYLKKHNKTKWIQIEESMGKTKFFSFRKINFLSFLLFVFDFFFWCYKLKRIMTFCQLIGWRFLFFFIIF